jgi:MFS family permease
VGSLALGFAKTREESSGAQSDESRTAVVAQNCQRAVAGRRVGLRSDVARFAAATVLRAAWKSASLRRAILAYLLFRAADSGVWIALLVYAFDHGGATSVLVVVLVQIVPCVIFSPLFGAVADYVRPSRMLKVSYAAQTAAIVGVCVAAGLQAPVAVVFLLASMASLVMSTVRPSHAALLPGIVRTPDELTAANVMGGWVDGAANLIGPGLAGALYAVGGVSLSLGVMGTLTFVSWAVVMALRGPTAAVALQGVDEERSRYLHRSDRFSDRIHRTLRSIGARVQTNLRQSLRGSQMVDLLILHTFYYVVVGALDLLCVLLAFRYLHLGPGGPGLLNSAVGAGGLLAGVLIVFLVGRRRLVGILTVSIAVALGALGLIGAWRNVGSTIVLVIVVGAGGAVFDTTSQTLTQRAAPPDSIAGSFSIREALANLGLALGVVLVRVVVSLAGLKAALLAPAVVGAILLVVRWHRLRAIDDAAIVPQVQIQLLRSLPLFAALPMQTLEGLAHRLTLELAPRGSNVITEGEPGDCYYCVADGRLSVVRKGRLVQTLTRGDGFGEMALLRNVPRQATVTADSDSVLYRLDTRSFLEMISSFPTASALAESVIFGYGDGEEAT